MWRSAARSIGACLALLCFFAVSSADPSPPSRADVTSGVRVAQRLIDTIPSPWRLDGDVRMAGDDAPVAQGNFVQASYALNKASLDSIATFSRAGNAMQFDSSGYLTYGPNNLLLQSNTFSNAAWAKNLVTVTGGVSDPVGGSNASTITATGVNAFIYQGPTVAAGTRIASQLYVKRRTGSGSVFLYDQDGFTNTVDITASISGGGWVAINPSVLTASGSNAYIGVKINTSGDAVDVYAGVVAAVTYETAVRTQDQVITTSAAYYGPRFDYTYNGSSWVPAGLLVEGSTTNLVPQSGNFASSWSTVGATRSTDGTLGPDGSTAMAKYTANASTGAHEFYTTAAVSFTSGSNYTSSIFVKKGNHRYVFINMETLATSGFLAVFDLDNPSAATQTWALGTGSYVSSKIENFGGIYRIQVTGAIATGTTAYQVAGFVSAATGNPTTSLEPSWTAAGTEYGYFFGAQLELGSSATSYIPTTTASVTRAAETVQLTGTALAAVQGVQGAVVYEGNGSRGTSVMVGSGGSQYRPYISGTSFSAYDGTTALSAAGSVPASSVWRGGVTWSAAGRSITLNGGAVASDASGTGTFTNAYLGNNNGSLWVNTHIRSVGFYNSRLPDATLQSKSVVNAAY